MAKKSTTKTKETVVKIDNIEKTIEAITEEALPVAVVEITEELEEIKPTEELANEVLANPEKAENILNEKLAELDKIEEKVQAEMEKVLKTVSPKSNSAFSYMWNGMSFYE